MDRAAMEGMLRETLEDRRMSRGERQALSEVLEEMNAGRQDLAVVRTLVFEIAREEMTDRAARDVLEWTEDAVRVIEGMRRSEPGETYADAAFTPGKECLRRVTGLLAGARQTADLCVFTIKDDRIARAIEKAHERGVSIRIVSDDEKVGDAGTDIPRLRRAGIPVALDDSPSHMHHKFAVIDGSLLMTGSFNWTRSAAEENQENLVITDDPRLVAPFREEFERLWREMSG